MVSAAFVDCFVCFVYIIISVDLEYFVSIVFAILLSLFGRYLICKRALPMYSLLPWWRVKLLLE